MSKDNDSNPDFERQKRNSEWERNRRDRLNDSFIALSRLLPNFEESKPLSKIETINQATRFIIDLQEQNKRLLMGDETKENVQKEKIHYLTERVRHLLSRNAQLATIIKETDIKIPTNEELRQIDRKNRLVEKLAKNTNELANKPKVAKSENGVDLNGATSDKAPEGNDTSTPSANSASDSTQLDPQANDSNLSVGSGVMKVANGDKKHDCESKKQEKSTKSLSKPAIIRNEIVQATRTPSILVTKHLSKKILPKAPNGKLVLPLIKVDKKRNRERDAELLKNIKRRKIVRKNGLDSKLVNLQKKLDDDINFDAELKSKKANILNMKQSMKKPKKPLDRTDKSKDHDEHRRQDPNKKQFHKNHTIDSLCSIKQTVNKTDKLLPNEKEVASPKITQNDSLGLNLPNNYELSNDILQTLHTPSHNSESLSPTAAFLINFPLVSSGTGGKNFEEENSSHLHASWTHDKDMTSVKHNVDSSNSFCMLNEHQNSEKFYMDLGRNSTNFRNLQSLVSTDKKPKDSYLESFDRDFNQFSEFANPNNNTLNSQNYYTYQQSQTNTEQQQLHPVPGDKQNKKVKTSNNKTVNWMTTPNNRNLPQPPSSNIDYLFQPFTTATIANNNNSESFLEPTPPQDWSSNSKYHHPTGDNTNISIPSTLPTLVGDLALNTTSTNVNSFNNFSVSHLIDRYNSPHCNQQPLPQHLQQHGAPPQNHHPQQQPQLNHISKVPNKNWNIFNAGMNKFPDDKSLHVGNNGHNTSLDPRLNSSHSGPNTNSEKAQGRKNWMDLNLHKGFQYSAESLISSAVGTPPSDIWQYPSQKLTHTATSSSNSASECRKSYGTNTFTPKMFPSSSNDYHDLILTTGNSLPVNTFDFDQCPSSGSAVTNSGYNMNTSGDSNNLFSNHTNDDKVTKKHHHQLQQLHPTASSSTSTKFKFNNDFSCLDNVSYYHNSEFPNVNYPDEFQQMSVQPQTQIQRPAHSQSQPLNQRNYYAKSQQNLSNFHVNTIIPSLVNNKV